MARVGPQYPLDATYSKHRLKRPGRLLVVTPPTTLAMTTDGVTADAPSDWA